MAHGDIKIFRKYGKWVTRFYWVVIPVWLLLAIAINLIVPQLEKSIDDHSAPFFPRNNPGVVNLQKMSKEFQTSNAYGLTTVLFVDDNGISAKDDDYYKKIVTELTNTPDGKKHISYLQDIYSKPAIRDIALSKDHKAILLTVMLKGEVGSSVTEHGWVWLKNIVHNAQGKPSGLKTYVTGGTPVFIEELKAIDSAMIKITIVSVILITLLLLYAYRSIVTIIIPLVTIGISLVVARAIISFLGMHDLMAISSFSVTMATGVVLGAGTDYAIFLLGRYHEERRKGVEKYEALARATGSVSGILIASGLTIAAASYSMVFTKVGFFRTSGPPITVGVLVTLAVALTLTPAAMAVAIKFGFLEPRQDKAAQYWRKVALRIIRNPLPLCVAVVAFLLACSLPIVWMKTNFEEPKMHSSKDEGNVGFRVSAQHFLPNATQPEYVSFHSDHDLRNSQDLAALELAAQAMAALPQVAQVQSITRPAGTPLAENTISQQSGRIGSELQQGINNAHNKFALLKKLAQGSKALFEGIDNAISSLPQLHGINGIIELSKNLIDSVDIAENLLRNNVNPNYGLMDALTQAKSYSNAILDIVRGISPEALQKLTQARDFFDELDRPVPSAHCQSDPSCMAARGLFAAINKVTHDQAHYAVAGLDPYPEKLNEAYQKLLAATPQLQELDRNVSSVISTFESGGDKPLTSILGSIRSGLDQLGSSVGDLTEGLGQVKDGTHNALEDADKLFKKLQEAADFLNDAAQKTPNAIGGYYMPKQGFSDPKYVQGSTLLISPDGHTARALVTLAVDPFSDEAAAALPAIYSAAHQAFKGTRLENAQIYSTGTAGVFRGLRQEVRHDFLLFGIISLLAILAILIVLLRSIVAPLILFIAVLLSYATTIGITVFISQTILGVPLHWAVGPVVFMLIIAVGSDYSMLFVSRIREESKIGFNSGMVSAFMTTGSVISTAGLVFALTMFALMAGGVVELAQIGVGVGLGLIIDILLVRTVLVPGVLVMLQKKAWWPSKLPA